MESNRIVSLQQGVDEFMDADRGLAVKTLLKVFAFEHPRNCLLCLELDKFNGSKAFQPCTVERYLCLFGI